MKDMAQTVELKYPALFLYERDTTGPGVFFPDLQGCVTCADNDVEGMEMAKEALSLYLHKSHLKAIPKPKSQNETIRVDTLRVNGLDYYALLIIYPDAISASVPDFPEFSMYESRNKDLSHERLQKSFCDYIGKLRDVILPTPRKIDEIMKIVEVKVHFSLLSDGIIYTDGVIEYKPECGGIFHAAE